MRFTIVTPVLNGMPWLPDAIESVARQREDAEVEHLVLDGGSTDGSREWLHDHAGLGFQLVTEPDRGQTDALANGFGRATGEILGWLNSDDLLEPRALARVEAALADSETVMVSGACLFIDARGRITGAMATPPDTSPGGLLTRRINAPQPSTFFRADAYRRAGGLDRQFDLAMDVDLQIRIARVGRYVVLPNEVLARYRVHPGAKSERASVASARDDLRARRKNGMPLRSPAGARLVWAGYARPLIEPAGRVLRSVARTLVLGSERRLNHNQGEAPTRTPD